MYAPQDIDNSYVSQTRTRDVPKRSNSVVLPIKTDSHHSHDSLPKIVRSQTMDPHINKSTQSEEINSSQNTQLFHSSSSRFSTRLSSRASDSIHERVTAGLSTHQESLSDTEYREVLDTINESANDTDVYTQRGVV